MKKTIILLLSFIISLLFTLNTYYKQNQQVLIEESNHLYTPKSLVIETTFSDFISNKEIKSRPFRLFSQVENEQLNIRAFYSNDYSYWNAPIHNGRFFKKNNESTALVGTNVPIHEVGGIKYFLYNSKKYEVIGYLGKYVPEYFQNSVLLSDNSFFSDEIGQYILDGDYPENSKEYLTISNQNNVGIGRFLNLDFFTPLLIMFTHLIIVLTTIFLAFLYNLMSQKERTIRFLLGTTHLKYLQEKLLILNSLLIISVLPMITSVNFIISDVGIFRYSMGLILYLLLINLEYIVIFFIDIRKEGLE